MSLPTRMTRTERKRLCQALFRARFDLMIHARNPAIASRSPNDAIAAALDELDLVIDRLVAGLPEPVIHGLFQEASRDLFTQGATPVPLRLAAGGGR